MVHVAAKQQEAALVMAIGNDDGVSLVKAIAQLNHKNIQTRLGAIEDLGRIAEIKGFGSACLSILIDLLDDDAMKEMASLEVHRLAEKGIVDSSALPKQIILLTDPNNVIRQNAVWTCLLYTSPSPRDRQKSRMPSSA